MSTPSDHTRSCTSTRPGDTRLRCALPVRHPGTTHTNVRGHSAEQVTWIDTLGACAATNPDSVGVTCQLTPNHPGEHRFNGVAWGAL